MVRTMGPMETDAPVAHRGSHATAATLKLLVTKRNGAQALAAFACVDTKKRRGVQRWEQEHGDNLGLLAAARASPG